MQMSYFASKKANDGDSRMNDISIKIDFRLGLENHIAIERKTLNDLMSCLTTGRERFEKELYRSKVLDYFALVEERGLDF